MSKEVKRFYITPGSVPALLSGDPAYTPMTNHLTDVHTVPLVLASDYDALLAERDALREALNFSCKSLCQVTSSDGSGHADIALSVLRLAGVGADEREALVDGWKANVQWRTDRAALQGEQK